MKMSRGVSEKLGQKDGGRRASRSDASECSSEVISASVRAAKTLFTRPVPPRRPLTLALSPDGGEGSRVRTPRGKLPLFFSILAIWSCFTLAAHAVTLSATLDRAAIRVGEQAVLTLRIEGGQPTGALRVPNVPNLQFQAGRLSQSTSIINGQMSQTVLVPIIISASQPGDYTIPAFQVPVATGLLPTQPLALKVHAADAKLPDSETYRQFTFARLRASKTNAFLGEPFTVELRLYFTGAREVQMPVFPDSGFLFTAVQHQQTQEQVGNAVYGVLIFPRVVTAVKTGKLALGPAQCAFNLQLRAAGNELFDLFNRGVRFQPVTILSEPLDINVQPLPPEGRPADFNGAVGSFQMSATLAPLEVAVGDPITLRVQVSGRGGLDGVRMPALELGEAFKSYPASATTEMPNPLNLTGVRKFEQVVQPQSADVKELPAFTFSFFDPEARAYRSIRQPATPIRVRAAAAAQAPTVVMTSTNTTAAAATELVHIKPHLGVVVTPGGLRQPVFWLMSGVPFVLWLALLTRRIQAEKLANNPRLRRRREVEKLVNAGLRELRQQAVGAQPEAFFANLFRLLQEQLGERLDLPASAITEDVIEERLQPQGASEGTCQSLHALFQACNAARYAPVRETAELAKLAEQFAAVVEELRGLEVKG